MSKITTSFYMTMIILWIASARWFSVPLRPRRENFLAIFHGQWRCGSRHPTSVPGIEHDLGFNQRDEDETGFEIGRRTRLGLVGTGVVFGVDAGVGGRVLPHRYFGDARLRL